MENLLANHKHTLDEFGDTFGPLWDRQDEQKAQDMMNHRIHLEEELFGLKPGVELSDVLDDVIADRGLSDEERISILQVVQLLMDERDKQRDEE